jgi:disulfide bond formation protein DsbB
MIRLRIEQALNILELASILIVLATAICMEIFLLELPCPLCLLQRVGLYLTALGFLMNLRFGLKPSHYAMVILGALFTALVALRQIALHVIPGTGAYGIPIFGLHLYTWSFIISLVIIAFTTILFGVDRQYKGVSLIKSKLLTNILFAALVIIVSINIVTVYIQCGFKECPDNPQASLFKRKPLTSD